MIDIVKEFGWLLYMKETKCKKSHSSLWQMKRFQIWLDQCVMGFHRYRVLIGLELLSPIRTLWWLQVMIFFTKNGWEWMAYPCSHHLSYIEQSKAMLVLMKYAFTVCPLLKLCWTSIIARMNSPKPYKLEILINPS